ncbi:gliding motility-associated C-terminal domain-containing protein [Chitinophaga arvensicola]|uniref:Gliding motility-associated C-terminal domain-containing protein n=1 Tax=Chitinophaga arvensicola TaxID=29529 RepID=A0A1I0QSF7_9BACT|nr:gliding motility-associated C-terminal domain-containing protein [Chitinophaga arvensicola]SEW30161.1 gliding motility-associated C-terminal domain-containing protein [Chitinophaga arvensicola]
MKSAVLLVLSCCLFPVFAAGYHIIGGEIFYKTLGMNGDNTRYRYLITLKLYRDADFTCGDRQGCIDRFENPVTANVFTSNGSRVLSSVYLYITATRPLIDTLKNPCLAPQAQHLEVAFYTATIELPPIPGGYYVASQRCCRGEKLANIHDSEHEGSTYYTTIPGTESRPNNNSAYFDKDTAIIICNSMPFTLDYAAYDEDGDSLTYNLCNALTDGSSANESNSTTPPPYNSMVSYIAPYSGSNPMGGSPGIAISAKGLLTCTPNLPGKYVVTVCVNEYDPVTKQLLGTHSKDILLTVFNCQTKITAGFPSVLNNCTEDAALHVPITNSSVSGFTSTYYWNFGDGTDTLTNSRTMFYHQYPDTGVYKVKMVVNPGLACTDSTVGEVFNYPGLRAGFTTNGFCKGDPITFNDTSSYQYGNITSHTWDMGTLDSVITPGPQRSLQYTFHKGDVYTVSLTLQTDKHCEKTVTKNLRVYEVNPYAGNDTILAKGQQMVMQGSGGEFYSWSPTDGLSDPNIAQPTLNYNKDISYSLRVSNQQGCVGYDSVQVKYYTGPEIYVPNAFSPNGDGLNDYFRFIPVGIVTYKFFRIFNRWGTEIYSSTDFRGGWDGTFKGAPAPVDTYIWILEGTDLNGKDILKRGTVTLVR